ncbi:MAG: ATP-binding protein [Gammaproteobacteria bacterium]|nr:ATP-binding protein [Gammaproteobacteria bacterium]MDE0443558.1 ATP-binding protein [Gammaproteobacteria bacterium]
MTGGLKEPKDRVLAAALNDRLLHDCHIVNTRDNSYRMRKRRAGCQDAVRTARTAFPRVCSSVARNVQFSVAICPQSSLAVL